MPSSLSDDLSDPGIVAKRVEPVGREIAPSAAQGIDDGGVSLKDAVREVPLPQMQPDPLHRVEFRRVGRSC